MKASQIWLRSAFLCASTVICWQGNAHAQHSGNEGGPLGYVVAGYYPDWRYAQLPPENIQLENLTHIIHAFIWPHHTGNGTLVYNSYYLNPPLNQHVHDAGKKILTAVGGYGLSSGFSAMAADPAARAVFIDEITQFCLNNNYDGVDFDWEFPWTYADGDNMVLLFQELRSHWDTVAPDLIITMAVNAGYWVGPYYDFLDLEPLVEWIGAMTYDYHGSWSGHSGHNSPLYTDPADPDAAGSWNFSIIDYLVTLRGIAPGKILGGIPFYGREFDGTSTLYGPSTGATDLSYADIVARSGYTRIWDPVSRVPYLTNTSSNTLITYDDETSVVEKTDYAASQSLAGVMIWEISHDLLPDGSQPLLQTVGDELIRGEILAMELPAFTAVSDENTIVISWEQEYTQPHISFDIQLASGGHSFRTVERSPSSAVLTDGRQRSAVIRNLLPGSYRVRLVISDPDGTFHATPPIQVEILPQDNLAIHSVYPNPADQKVTVRFSSREDRVYQVTIRDVLGKRVTELPQNPAGTISTGSITIDTTSLPDGLYLVSLTTPSGRIDRPFIVTHVMR